MLLRRGLSNILPPGQKGLALKLLRYYGEALADQPKDPTSLSCSEDTPSDGSRFSQRYEFTGTMGALLEKEKVKLYEMISKPAELRNKTAIDEFSEKLEKSFPPSMHLYNILLKSKIVLKEPNGIRQVLETIKKTGRKFNLITYNLMIGYYRDQHCPNDAEQLILKMTDCGIEPNQYTYTTLISAFSRTNLEKSVHYFELAKPKMSDIYLYNTMIRTYVLHDDLIGADQLVHEMTDAGLKPNFVTFKIILEGLIRAARIEEAWTMYEGALSRCEELKIGDYSEICRWFWNVGAREEALKVCQDMEKMCGHLDNYAVSRALQYAIVRSNVQLVNRILEQYVEPRPERFEKILKKMLILSDKHQAGEGLKKKLLVLLKAKPIKTEGSNL